MSLKVLRSLIKNTPIYKMSLGKDARYRAEALLAGALVFQSERNLYDAVVSGLPSDISKAGAAVKAELYPNANAPDRAWKVWARTIETFRALPENALILHWEANEDRLHWGVVGPTKFYKDRDERNEFGQEGYIFHRPLRDGWHTKSVNEVPISNIHPSARSLAINLATLNFVQTDADYFRALILDEDTSAWTDRPTWRDVARAKGWYPKRQLEIRAVRRAKIVTPEVVEAARYVFDEAELLAEIARMAKTAVYTAAYANGQTELRTVKPKDIGFTQAELEEEIAYLLKTQDRRCALTGFAFRPAETNPHLKLSLDRKDSGLGYISDNLQVVTRAANFFKSASNEADWHLKEDALYRMAVAIHQRRKTQTNGP